MTQPRIVILHYATPPTIGGVESTIAVHARLMAEHGYAAHIVTGRGEPFDARVPVTIVPDAGSRSPRVRQMNALLGQGIVDDAFHHLTRDLVQQLTPLLAGRLVIAHNVLSLHKNLALTAALKQIADGGRIRLIAWCHDFAWTDPQYAGEVHAGYPWDLLRVPWEHARYVVVSEARRRELQALWGEQALALPEVEVVPPGIDPPRFLCVTEQTAQWVREFDLLGASPLLLLPARVTRRKNIEYAMEITASLREQGLAAKLVVTGPPGPHNPANAAYLEQLQALRASLGLGASVILLHEFGAVDDAALRDLYLLADALLLPSEREGFGIPLLEAAVARLPIFCSDLAPFRDTARENAHYLSRDRSPRQAALFIAATLAADPAFRHKQHVSHAFRWEQIFSERIEPLLKSDDLPPV